MFNFSEIIGFEWDKANSLKNFIKHKVTNSECEEIFINKPLLFSDDVKHSGYEDRILALGKTSEGRKLSVSFTIRSQKIRIISSRDMSKKERKIYDEKEI